uniref:Uncharacterized protein n=1 Tax=Arundo donax TaxID=35708 RepID=A0A0A9C8I8_ARUDO
MLCDHAKHMDGNPSVANVVMRWRGAKENLIDGVLYQMPQLNSVLEPLCLLYICYF